MKKVFDNSIQFLFIIITTNSIIIIIIPVKLLWSYVSYFYELA